MEEIEFPENPPLGKTAAFEHTGGEFVADRQMRNHRDADLLPHQQFHRIKAVHFQKFLDSRRRHAALPEEPVKIVTRSGSLLTQHQPAAPTDVLRQRELRRTRPRSEDGKQFVAAELLRQKRVRFEWPFHQRKIQFAGDQLSADFPRIGDLQPETMPGMGVHVGGNQPGQQISPRSHGAADAVVA